jgi:hypothetical protein
MRSVLGLGRWMAGPIGEVSVQGTRTSHNRWSPDVGILMPGDHHGKWNSSSPAGAHMVGAQRS